MKNNVIESHETLKMSSLFVNLSVTDLVIDSTYELILLDVDKFILCQGLSRNCFSGVSFFIKRDMVMLCIVPTPTVDRNERIVN